jgi:Ser/Thr protein kinase RdoA (MazF antagonist)
MNFNDLTNKLNIGELTLPAKRVYGGYMHKMYCIETTVGKYAVKLLNPEIMKRPDALEDYQLSERLEQVLSQNNIPVVTALEFNGKKMQMFNNQHFYIYNWIDGKALDSENTEKSHCIIIGRILAQIHKIERIDKPYDSYNVNIDWDYYINLSKEKCPEITKFLANNRELLQTSQINRNNAVKKLPGTICICNSDMDYKNVLWVSGEPKIIDLESLCYSNPFKELFQLALSWSGYVHGNLDYELLGAFIESYRNEYGDFKVDWQILYHSYFGEVEWLEYNVKRALMLECEDEEERQLGIEQVSETIGNIIYYDSIKDELLKRLNN